MTVLTFLLANNSKTLVAVKQCNLPFSNWASLVATALSAAMTAATPNAIMWMINSSTSPVVFGHVFKLTGDGILRQSWTSGPPSIEDQRRRARNKFSASLAAKRPSMTNQMWGHGGPPLSCQGPASWFASLLSENLHYPSPDGAACRLRCCRSQVMRNVAGNVFKD